MGASHHLQRRRVTGRPPEPTGAVRNAGPPGRGRPDRNAPSRPGARTRLIYAEAADKIEAAGVQVHTFRGPVDLDSIGADAEAMVAAEEKRAISRRVKESVAARRRAGFYIGAAPFGLRWQDKRLAV